MLVSPQGHRLFHFDPVNGVPYGRPGSLRQRIMAGNALVGGQFGVLTTPYAGASGKWYVDSTGTYQLAAQGVPYLHHEYDATLSRWTPRGLLWETGRANKLVNGWDVSQTGNWSRTGLSAGTLGTTTAAGLTLTKLEEDTSLGGHVVYQTYTLSGTTLAMKTVLLAAERGWALVYFTATASKYAYINLSTGAVGVTAGSPVVKTRKLAGSAWEVEVVLTGMTAGSGATCRVYAATADNTSSYQGETGKGIYVGPVILVDGASEVGSLIPTAGTRTADVPSISSAWMNAGFKNAGRITVRYTPNAATATARRCLWSFLDGSANGALFSISNGAKLSVLVNSGAANLESAALTWVAGQTYDLVLQWSGTTFTAYRDGVAVAGPTALSAISTVNSSIILGTNVGSSIFADGAVESIYAEAL